MSTGVVLFTFHDSQGQYRNILERVAGSPGRTQCPDVRPSILPSAVRAHYFSWVSEEYHMATNAVEWSGVDPLRCKVDVNDIYLGPKVFKTGSRGWHYSGKISVGDERVQLSICAIVIGSKPTTEKANSSQENGKAKKRPKKAPEAVKLADGTEAIEVEQMEF